MRLPSVSRNLKVPCIVAQVVGSIRDLRMIFRFQIPHPKGHCTLTRVPFRVAFSLVTMFGAQPVAVPTVAVAGLAPVMVTTSLPSAPKPRSGAPWTTNWPGEHMGGGAATARLPAMSRAGASSTVSAERIVDLPPGTMMRDGEGYRRGAKGSSKKGSAALRASNARRAVSASARPPAFPRRPASSQERPLASRLHDARAGEVLVAITHEQSVELQLDGG